MADPEESPPFLSYEFKLEKNIFCWCWQSWYSLNIINFCICLEPWDFLSNITWALQCNELNINYFSSKWSMNCLIWNLSSYHNLFRWTIQITYIANYKKVTSEIFPFFGIRYWNNEKYKRNTFTFIARRDI